MIIEHLEKPIVTWLVAMICSSNCIKNIHLLGKIIEIISLLSPDIHPLVDTFYSKYMSHDISQNLLPSCLLKFYTDVEKMGANAEFYDKFSVRYHINVIFKAMWSWSPIHHQVLIEESKRNKEFVKFINTLMNDTSFLLEEILDSLKRIHETQEMIADRETWIRMLPEERHLRINQLSADERQCSSYLPLAKELMNTFTYLTVDIKEPFLKPEVVQRLASMLNFNLEKMSGSYFRNIMVKSPGKYGWDPRKFLTQLVDIYLHLDSEEFAAAIASDDVSNFRST